MQPTAFAGLLVALLVPGCRAEPEAPPETAQPSPATPEVAAPTAEPIIVPDANPPPRSVPTAPAEKAILEGLAWLARHQNDDGSWSPQTLAERCAPGSRCVDPRLSTSRHYDDGLTALAVLAFLHAGFDTESPRILTNRASGQERRVGDVIRRGLTWLRGIQKPDGSFGTERPFLYSEALATLAMVEAYGAEKDAQWEDSARRGIEFLQAAQRPSPTGRGLWGWRYSSRQDEELALGPHVKEISDADTSVTAWCVIALRAAYDRGLRIRQESMDGAMAFSRFATGDDGLVGYLDAQSAGVTVTGPFDERFTYHVGTMSALGMVIRVFAASDPDDPFLDLAAKRIVMDRPSVSEDRASVDYYYWHAATLALYQLDGPSSPRRSGKYWQPWNKALLESVLSLQDHTEGACTNGGWIQSDRWGSYSGAGALYDTAINVLTLEVPYRYDNAFPRHRSAPPGVGAPAPGFEGSEEPASKFALSDYRGRVVLIDFWNPGDEHFDASLAERAQLAERMSGRPFVILGVGLDRKEDPRYPAAAGLHPGAWRWTREDSKDRSIRRAYGIDHAGTVVVDDSGTIRGRGDSWIDWERTTALIERLVREAETDVRPR